MSQQPTIKNILDQEVEFYEKEITLVGIVSRFKFQKKFMFGAIDDGSEPIGLQFVHTFVENDSLLEFANTVTVGTSVRIRGKIVKSPAKGQSIELQVSDVNIIDIIRNPETYLYGSDMNKRRNPVQMEERSIMIRSDIYGRFRDKRLKTIMRIRSACKSALYKYFDQEEFIQCDTPLITNSDCEGAGETFQVTTLDLDNIEKVNGKVDYSKDFFGVKANLTVSGQLESEALCRSLFKVWTFGPTFRAENSNTSRHLSEFWMLEPEWVCTNPIVEDRINDLMDFEEAMIKFVIQDIFIKCDADLQFLNATLKEDLRLVFNSSFERITYTKAIELLLEATVTFEESNIVWGMDLKSEHECYICETIYKKPVFITNYPQDLKSFYMKADVGCEEGRQTCQAIDLIVPGIGELCGGSVREDDPVKLEAVMNKKGMDIPSLQWYIDLRKDGGFPTMGFGIGFERFIRFMTETKSIRDVIPYTRYKGHI